MTVATSGPRHPRGRHWRSRCSSARWCRGAAVVAALVLLPSCSKKKLEVHQEEEGFDFGRAELLAAVDEAAATPDSPQAIAKLARVINGLTGQFNQPVADEAERKLVFMALGPMVAGYTEKVDQNMDTLALTVWPIALRAPPEKNESPREYVERMCSSILALECKYSVQRYWPILVSSVVWRRLQKRARKAYINCGPCQSEPADTFGKALERYRSYQTKVGALAQKVRKRAHHSQWPRAHAGAHVWDDSWPLLELLGDGSATFRGEDVGAAWRRIIAERRNGAHVLGVHLRPTTDVRSLQSLLDDARKAGYDQIALQARMREFPYAAKAYRVPTRGRHIQAKPDDSIELFVRRRSLPPEK